MEGLELDKAMSQLLAELNQALLPSRDLVVPVNAPPKRQLRCPLAKKNLELVARETAKKRKRAIKARAPPVEMKTQEENVNESIKPMFSPNNSYHSVGDYLLFDSLFETHVVPQLTINNVSTSHSLSSSSPLLLSPQCQLKISFYRRMILQYFVAFLQIEIPLTSSNNETVQQSLSSTSFLGIRQILPQQTFACFLNACAEAGVVFAKEPIKTIESIHFHFCANHFLRFFKSLFHNLAAYASNTSNGPEPDSKGKVYNAIRGSWGPG